MKVPGKLKRNDEIRVVSPSRSLSTISESVIKIAIEKLEKMGLKVTFSKNSKETDEFNSSSIKSRIDDLHDSFEDNHVKAVITTIGGFNSNQLLRYIDFKIVKNNPKIFCGYSDITALNDTFLQMSDLVTYSGPHFSSFGMLNGIDYTIEYFKKCLFSEDEFLIEPSEEWSDDRWYTEQGERKFMKNDGHLLINDGKAEGTIVGANLCTFNLLEGTEYMPSLKKTVLFIEDDHTSNPVTFDRDLQSLIHQPDFDKVKGMVIGRFQIASEMTSEKLIKIIETKKELENIPVVANVDFGHTTPQITFPIGGRVKLKASDKGEIQLELVEH
jgi:muramoyltetrapeptide carboxypeptidase